MHENNTMFSNTTVKTPVTPATLEENIIEKDCQ